MCSSDLSYRKKSGRILEHFKSMKGTANNAHDEREIEMMVGYFEAQVRSADSIHLIQPDSLFSDHLEISGSKETVELIEFSGGHTESDAILLLPKHGIAFAGDLLFTEHHPWIGDGDIDKWIAQLTQLSQMKIKKFVPGHGTLSDSKGVTTLKKYFDDLKKAAAAVKEKYPV